MSGARAQGRSSLLDRVENVALIVAAICLVGVVAAQAWQVVSRYFFGDPPSWTDPLSTTFMAHAAMIGAAAGVRRNSHFAFTSLTDAAPRRLQNVANLVARLVVIAAGGMLLVYGAHLVMLDADAKMPGAPLSLGLRYTPLALGGLLMMLFGGEALISRLKSETKP